MAAWAPWNAGEMRGSVAKTRDLSNRNLDISGLTARDSTENMCRNRWFYTWKLGISPGEMGRLLWKTGIAANCLHGRSCKSLLNSTGRRFRTWLWGCRTRDTFPNGFREHPESFPNGHIPQRWHQRAGSRSHEVERLGKSLTMGKWINRKWKQDTRIGNSYCDGNMMIRNYDFPNQPMILDISWDNSKCHGRGCQVNDQVQSRRDDTGMMGLGGVMALHENFGRGSQFEPTGISSPAGWKAESKGPHEPWGFAVGQCIDEVMTSALQLF